MGNNIYGGEGIRLSSEGEMAAQRTIDILKAAIECAKIVKTFTCSEKKRIRKEVYNILCITDDN